VGDESNVGAEFDVKACWIEANVMEVLKSDEALEPYLTSLVMGGERIVMISMKLTFVT
jgi:hypothetical protein